MTPHEWKPGDVGMYEGEGETNVALVVRFSRLGCPGGHEMYPVHAHLDDGDWSTVADLRPLVVIDPEDREQVQRLARALPLYWNLEQPDDPDLFVDSVNEITSALREFATPTPPKPEEPQGLGAVVEDAEGQQWVAIGGLNDRAGSFRWREALGTHTGRTARWCEIAAVRVLSEGLT